MSWSFQRHQCPAHLHPLRAAQPKIMLKPTRETASLVVLIPTRWKITLHLLSYWTTSGIVTVVWLWAGMLAACNFTEAHVKRRIRTINIYIMYIKTTRTKTTHANSPSLWTSRGWDTLRSARAQMKLWFLDAFPSLSPPPCAVHVPCPGGLHSSDSGLCDRTRQLGVPRVTHLGRPGEASETWCFITSAGTNLLH